MVPSTTLLPISLRWLWLPLAFGIVAEDVTLYLLNWAHLLRSLTTPFYLIVDKLWYLVHRIGWTGPMWIILFNPPQAHLFFVLCYLWTSLQNSNWRPLVRHCMFWVCFIGRWQYLSSFVSSQRSPPHTHIGTKINSNTYPWYPTYL